MASRCHARMIWKNSTALRATAGAAALARYDFSETTDYGVLVRYDLEFWPDQSTAGDAVTQAQQVFDLVVNTLPAECRP